VPLAALLIPTASQCLRVGWPLVLFGFAFWFWRHGDTVIARLFPHWGWEADLGWLNIKAHRQAERIVRVLTHLLHLALLVALVGILYISWNFAQPHDPDDRLETLILFMEWFYMFVCYGAWIYYLGFVLYPRIRDEFELEELERYRLEHPDPSEEEKKMRRDKIAQTMNRPRRF